MLRDLIRCYSSRRGVFKPLAVLAGMAVLVIGVVEKVGEVKSFLWMAAPLLLLGLAEARLVAEQRRCWELLKKHGDISVPPAEGVGTYLMRYGFAVISLSIWPLYLALFGLIAGGGDQIARANRQAAMEIAAARPQPATSLPSYYPPKNMPGNAMRPNNGQMPFNPVNPSVNRFTPSPFPTPPRFPMPNRPPATPVRFATPPSVPLSSPNNSPAPAVKNP